jgi:hypothetical protein
MNRREFMKALIVGGSGLIFNKSLACGSSSLPAGSRILPPPQVNTHSSEIVLNTRRSYHGGYYAGLSDQVLANVLWATSRAPLLGASRIIYVARPDNVYQYDPDQHEIFVHEPGNHLSETNLSFEVGVASDLVEDSGSALYYGLLAATSFWTSTSNQPSCCPKETARDNANSSWNPASSIHMVHCYSTKGVVSGITDLLVAISSNQSLPDPLTNGQVLLENALGDLSYGSQFSSNELALNQISQLAWASYGCTPHLGTYDRAALTVPSAIANYYLTGRIYIVRLEGVERYHNRLPGGQLTTRDHRIERVTDGDRRPLLRSAITRLPQTASVYFVYCIENIDRWEMIETGYCAAGVLLQASSMDLQGYFTGDFTSAERTAIINALSIPSNDLPVMIASLGFADVGIDAQIEDNLHSFKTTPNPFRLNTSVRYSLVAPAHVMLTVHDANGRFIKTLVDRRQSAGSFSAKWDGTDLNTRNLPSGVYHYILRVGRHSYQRKVIKV